MIQDLFIISFRMRWRDCFFTLLNAAGLSVGMVAAVLMFLWVNESSLAYFTVGFDAGQSDSESAKRIK